MFAAKPDAIAPVLATVVVRHRRRRGAGE